MNTNKFVCFKVYYHSHRTCSKLKQIIHAKKKKNQNLITTTKLESLSGEISLNNDEKHNIQNKYPLNYNVG